MPRIVSLRSRVPVFGVVLATIALVLAPAAPAAADGPFEPNETPAQAATPFAGGSISAGLETPQDVDWFRFYALPSRQIGVLATLTAPCQSSVGGVRVAVLDGDAGYSGSLGTIQLGFNYGGGPPVSAGRVAFTSLRGHRYFVKVTQSLCPDAAYTLQVAPAMDLTSRLLDTIDCVAAKVSASRSRRRASGLASSLRRAHGAKRRRLREALALQRQNVTVAAAEAASACRRPALTGYPFA